MRYFFLTLISLLVLSCTPSPCPELSRKKPNYYIEEYLTYDNDGPYTGRCAVYVADTLSSIQQYKNGYENGKWKFYYKNGVLETNASFDMGKRVGAWEYFYKDGKLMQISNYKDGNRDGFWYRLENNGDTIWTEEYSEGKLIN